MLICGLLATAGGQVILNLLSIEEFSIALYYDAPIDYGHWLLLIGAALMIPFAARHSGSLLKSLSGTVLIVGIISVIGMATFDLIMWSLDGTGLRADVTERLKAEPSIWLPFIVIGPPYLFITGLALSSLTYLRGSKIGVALVVGSAVVVFTFLAGMSAWFFVLGYALMAVGYALCFSGDVARDGASS